MSISEIESAYMALFKPDIDRFSKPHSRERCSLNANQISTMGLSTGQQVRIERPTENGTTLALYTIKGAHGGEPNSVFLDYEDPDDIKTRFGLSNSHTDSFQGKINSQVAAVGLSEDKAKAYSEFIEELTDDDHNRELVVIAPHGGDIEEHTDEQAEEVAKQLVPSKCVSVWMCKGFKKDGGAFARWHITSTDISEESFPKLKTIIGRHFRYAIAFHGWDGEKNSICIGGTIPYNLKCEIKRAIADAVSGSGIVVAIGGDYYSDDKTCPENFNGNNKNNIVNRLSPNGGIQIEQSKKARKEYGRKIAEAVVNVMRPMLTESGFFRPNEIVVSEQELRNAIGSGAQTEKDKWRDMTTGNVIREEENSQFGLLVRYWLGSKSRIRPTTLEAVQTNAVSSTTNYGQLLNDNATEAAVSAEAETVRATLLMGAPDTASPMDIRTLVKQSLISARFSRLDDDNKGRWSGAFVVSVLRKAAIQLGLEAMDGRTHLGRNELLAGTSAHRIYVLEAYNRRFGANQKSGTYYAFRPSERIPQIGDIIIQDRLQVNNINNVVKFDDIPTTLNSEYNLHGDIVVEVSNDAEYVIAIGGNVGDSIKRRRYPLDDNRHLVVDRTQLYTQEGDSGSLPNLPATDNSSGLHTRSTGRIFALLSLVRQCADIPG